MRGLLASLVLGCAVPAGFAADITKETQRAFDRYVQLTEARLARTLNDAEFLYSKPSSQQRAKLRSGATLITPQDTLDNGKEIEAPGGLIQDWIGLLFLPRATIAQVREVLQDYANYKEFYKPEVIGSRELAHHDDEYDVFLRLRKTQFITVVLNGEYRVKYGQLDPAHLYVDSRSTKIAEVKNPNRSYTDVYPPGHDDGFLWALNSYWRFEEADGGVYAQLEAVSLSRDLPFGLGWLKGSLQKFPKDSMETTLRGTKKAVEHLKKRRGA